MQNTRDMTWLATQGTTLLKCNLKPSAEKDIAKRETACYEGKQPVGPAAPYRHETSWWLLSLPHSTAGLQHIMVSWRFPRAGTVAEAQGECRLTARSGRLARECFGYLSVRTHTLS